MSRDDLRSSCSQSRTCILFLIQVNAFKYFQCNEISCASVGNMFRQIMLSRAARRRPDALQGPAIPRGGEFPKCGMGQRC